MFAEVRCLCIERERDQLDLSKRGKKNDIYFSLGLPFYRAVTWECPLLVVTVILQQ